MSRLAAAAAVFCLFAAPALAQEDDFDYLKKMQLEANRYMDTAQAAYEAGDDAGMCNALKQATVSLGSGYMTASTAADELSDYGGSSDDIGDLREMEGYFRDQMALVSELTEGCA